MRNPIPNDAIRRIDEAAHEWLRERAPAERGNLSMITAFKDGARWGSATLSEQIVAIEPTLHQYRMRTADNTSWSEWLDGVATDTFSAGTIADYGLVFEQRTLFSHPKAMARRLEWIKIDGWEKEHAQTPFGVYTLWANGSLYFNGAEVREPGDVDEAKVAAQADFEQRVRDSQVRSAAQAQPVSYNDAHRHAVALRQCSLFAADVGEHIVKAMVDAADFLDRAEYAESRVRDLEDRLAKAAEALEPIAEIAPLVETTDRRDGERVHEQRRADGSYHVLTRDDFRRARTALSNLRTPE